MLTPDELKAVPDNIVKIYQTLEDDIIADIARRLEKTGEITDTADWQMYMLGQMGNDLEGIKKRITDTNKISKRELDALFKDAAGRSMEYENVQYRKAGKGAMTLADSPTMQQFVKANVLKTHAGLKNLTKSLGFKVGNRFLPVAQTYQSVLDYAQFQVASGAFSPRQAVQIAVRSLADSGLRTVDYASGRSSALDVAVRRATLTGINQTTAQLSLMQMDELGGEYVEVTAHMGARPDHATWQGKVYHVDGEKNGYPDFEESTGYGTGPGLCGWNCRHSFSVFFPGISTRNYSDETLQNIDPPPFEYEGKTYTYYEATQKQRQIERQMRKTKREMIAYDAAGAKDDFTATAIKLRGQKDQYVAFSRAAGLKTRHERAAVYGFGRSTSQKGVRAVRKSSTGAGGSTAPIAQATSADARLAAALDRALEHGKKTGTECLMWLDLNYNEVLPFAAGKASSVSMTREDFEFLRSLDKDSIMSIHNHPRSSSFSSTDINTACMLESVKEMQVIAHDGTRYFLEIADGDRPPFHKIDDEFAKTQNSLQSKYMEMYRQTGDKYGTWKEHSHEVNEKLAEKFGWKYRRELPK